MFANTFFSWLEDAITGGLKAIRPVFGPAFVVTVAFALLSFVGSFFGFTVANVPYLGVIPGTLGPFVTFFIILVVVGMFLNFVGAALGLRKE